MSSATTLLSPPWNVLHQVRGILAQRSEQRALELELAGYTSENDLNELSAILARHSEDEGEAIRRILAARA